MRVGWPMRRETWFSSKAPISLSLPPIRATSASSQRAERSRSNHPSAAGEAGTAPVSSRAHASQTTPLGPSAGRGNG